MHIAISMFMCHAHILNYIKQELMHGQAFIKLYGHAYHCFNVLLYVLMCQTGY